ncbi:MAG: HAD family hydrolase, partial [Candidatus Bathyarchaeia archaeon]
MTIKAVVFDLDGTIVAFNLDYKTLRGEVRSYLLNMGVPSSLLKVNETIFEMLKKTEIYMKNQGKPATTLEGIRKETLKTAEKYELEAAKQTNLLSGALETLKILKRAGLKIGLCTLSSEKSALYLLKKFKLDEYFDSIISRDRVNHVK